MSAPPSGRSTPLPAPPAQKRFDSGRRDYQANLAVIASLQSQLKQEAADLAKEHGWDAATRGAINDWLDDENVVFRALRRNRFDADKTHSFFLTAIPRRAEKKLHEPLPPIPDAYKGMFYVLPLPDFTDRLGRPVAVLNVRNIVRNDSGLDDLKEMSWWAVEWVKRVMDEWWTQKNSFRATGEADSTPRGQGGEGMVVIVDARGGGYRNLEVELLPVLMHIGHDNSPGMIENVYVVNLSTMQSYLWTVVKRMLPAVALEKIGFLENEKQVREVFDLEKLPRALGGQADLDVISDQYDMHKRYQAASSPSRSRSSSTSSTSHSFRTAPSVDPSRPPSRQTSAPSGLRMTTADAADTDNDNDGTQGNRDVRAGAGAGKGAGADRIKRSKSLTVDLARLDAHSDSTVTSTPRTSHATSPSSESGVDLPHRLRHRHPRTSHHVSAPVSRSGSRVASASATATATASASSSRRSSIAPSQTPLQRIKSLSDFHLYLSPSRLAHIDLINDSDSDDEPPPVLPALILPRRKLVPAMLEHRKPPALIARPPLRILGPSGRLQDAEMVRTYSDRLQRHHAEVLQVYRDKGDIVSPTLLPSAAASTYDEEESAGQLPISAPALPSPAIPPSFPTDHFGLHPQSSPADEADMPTPVPVPGPSPTAPAGQIALYSRSNPFFGYPTTVASDGTLVPLHYRRRKRDLVKTLLFLIMLRLQSLRFWLERLLGLHHLSRLRSFRDIGEARTPAEGLVRQRAETKVRSGRNAGDREWVWTMIGVLLLRGAWTSWLDGPLRLLGMEAVREVLGLV